MGLHDPFRLGDLALPNRIVMAPMTRRRAAEGKLATALMATYYAQRAEAGLIVTESIEVDPLAGIAIPTRPGLANQTQAGSWKQVTEAVHAAGGRIFAQLSHMGRTAHPSQLLDGGPPVAPSAIAAAGTIYTNSGPQPYARPRALSVPGIEAIVEQFGVAAAHAVEAGFDGIELHGANGYLIDQFLRDGSNRREDSYGGNPAGRARFLLEIAAAAMRHWPAGRIGVRVSPTNSFQDMSDSDPVGHFTAIAERLEPLGLAYLHLVEPPVQPPGVPRVAPSLRGAFSGPLILAGGYDALTAAAVIEAGGADLVAFGQAFIANPDLVRRLERNAPLNAPDRASFYTQGEKGYTDYPAHEPAQA